MVYGVLKLINFAHGDVMMVGVYIGLRRRAAARARGAQTLAAGACCWSSWWRWSGCALLGFLIERFAYRPLREQAAAHRADHRHRHLASRSRTASSSTSASCPAPRRAPSRRSSSPHEWLIIGDRDVVIWNWQVISFVIAVGLMVVLQYLVFRTRFGRAMRAVSLRPPRSRR